MCYLIAIATQAPPDHNTRQNGTYERVPCVPHLQIDSAPPHNYLDSQWGDGKSIASEDRHIVTNRGVMIHLIISMHILIQIINIR